MVEVVTLIGPLQFFIKTLGTPLGTPQNRSIEELPIGPSYIYIYESSTLGKIICGIMCGAIWEHLGEHVENLGGNMLRMSLGKWMENEKFYLQIH